MELAVAMVAEVQKGEEVAGCWEEVVEAASCPLEVEADLQGNQESCLFFYSRVQFIVLAQEQVCLTADLNLVIIYTFIKQN